MTPPHFVFSPTKIREQTHTVAQQFALLSIFIVKTFETTATLRYNMIQYNYEILTDIVPFNSSLTEAILWM